MVNERTTENMLDRWVEIVNEYLPKDAEETKILWNIISQNFEAGGERDVKNYIRERFSSLENQILSAIEKIKKTCPEG